MSKIEIQATNVFHRNYQADTRIIVNEGGSRSSKTYSLAQLFIVKALQEQNKVFTIARKTLSALRSTAMRDFFEILTNLNLYEPKNHNKSDRIYYLNKNLIEFVGLDDPQKKRGAKRDYLWMNEANEFTPEDFRQLSMRTTGQIYMDYNPSEIEHWIYDQIIPRDDCTFIQSTYRDNPFAPKEVVQEIERLKDADDTDWKIYGLGERARPQNVIYTNWSISGNNVSGEKIYGLDFGYNVPTALIEITMNEREAFEKELLYETKLTNSDLIERLKELIPNKYSYIYADNAEPDRIEEISRAGFNIHPADKNVKAGIDFCKRLIITVDKNSTNLIKEYKGYKWKQDKNGNILDEPVKYNDHGIDAVRYAKRTYALHHMAGATSIGLPAIKETKSKFRDSLRRMK